MSRLPKLVLAALVAAAASVPLVAASDSAAQGTAKPAPAAQTTAMVTKVQAFYDKTTSFESEFTQEFFVKSHNVRKQSKGLVTFAKPGKMDWVYEEPKDNRVVSDGAVLRVYEAANKQMFEQNVDKSQYPAALAFLTGDGKLANLFDFELYDGAAMSFRGGQVLVGTPKQATPAYQKVLFYVDTDTAQVRRVLIVDGQGNRNRFDFVNPKVNVPVKEDRFKFTPPPGTQVIKP
jgi:outer membrane lipoprotein carrier protein